MKKVSLAELSAFESDYFDFENKYFKPFPFTLRYGQAFCNTFGITDPNLYYCESISEAKRQIREKYLNIGE